MQDYEPKNAMELADRIWGAISYERSVNHGRNDELELHLNTQSWIELLKLYEEGHVTIMSMNPMEYVDKKVYSYAHLHRNDVGYAYAQSIYTGMFFNSYC